MDADRHARLTALFARAQARPSHERSAFLDDACGEDDALRDELRALLAADEDEANYFDGLAARVLPSAFAAVTRGTTAAHDAALPERLQEALAASYRIERELGGGGMSRVFLAEEVTLSRKVVIKVLPPEMAAAVNVERFRREIRVLAQLQHPHVVPLLTAGSVDDLLYYTMPFVAGESLRARLAREGALPVADAVRIWRQLLDALSHAHACDVVHRDVKPANILLDGRHARVTDFGIAWAIAGAAGDTQITGADLTIGTPAYMAPEQLTGAPDADRRVDVYAAGLVMYEMLAGRLPFSGSSSRDLARARLTDAPAPLRRPDCPAALAALVLRCLAADRNARPAGVENVLVELEGIASRTRDAARGHRLRHIAAYTAVALVGAAAAVEFQDRRAPAARPAAVEVAGVSVAVLPLRNLSPDTADAVLADGMTAALITSLGSVGKLSVIASTSSLALRDAGLDPQQAAESLGVRYVVQGAFQKASRRVRLQLRLVDTHDGSTLWNETYDRTMVDLPEVQHDVAHGIARALSTRVAATARVSPDRRPLTTSVAAYEWYLRGVDVALLRSDSGRRAGVRHFHNAIAADSGFAAAYAGLAHVQLARFNAARPGDRPTLRAQAEAAARTAISLDDSLAEARAALGWVHIAKHNWDAAERELRLAVALDVNVRRGHEGLARLYMWRERPAQQLAAARMGAERDPFSHSAIRELGLALLVNGRCEEALARLRPLKALVPPAGVAGVVAGQCHLAHSEWEQAIAELRWARESSDATAVPALLGYALARSGQREEAAHILAELLDGRTYSHGAFGVAMVHAGLRDFDAAFRWLERSVEDGSVTVYLMGPAFDEMRRDPRFAPLRRRLGI